MLKLIRKLLNTEEVLQLTEINRPIKKYTKRLYCTNRQTDGRTDRPEIVRPILFIYIYIYICIRHNVKLAGHYNNYDLIN